MTTPTQAEFMQWLENAGSADDDLFSEGIMRATADAVVDMALQDGEGLGMLPCMFEAATIQDQWNNLPAALGRCDPRDDEGRAWQRLTTPQRDERLRWFYDELLHQLLRRRTELVDAVMMIATEITSVAD